MKDNGIEVFQELHLKECSASISIRNCILSQAQDPWRHDVEREKMIKGGFPGDEDVVVLVRASFDDIDDSGLVLWQEKGGYRVANIVPQNVSELGITKYNTILMDFVDRVVKPAAENNEFEIELTSSRQTLEDWMTEGPAIALRRFSRSANKSTGASHPMDQARWFTFLIEAYRSPKRADSEHLARWLIEIEGWPEHTARELAIDYEFALGLLEQYGQSRL